MTDMAQAAEGCDGTPDLCITGTRRCTECPFHTPRVVSAKRGRPSVAVQLALSAVDRLRNEKRKARHSAQLLLACAPEVLKDIL